MTKVAEEERKKSDSEYVNRGLAKAVSTVQALGEIGGGKTQRIPVGSVEVDGMRYEIGTAFFAILTKGDWVMLQNSNDADRPIIAQIFKTWQTVKQALYFGNFDVLVAPNG